MTQRRINRPEGARAEVVTMDRNTEGGCLIACDVRDQASVGAAVQETLQRLGGLDVLVNCSGLATRKAPKRRPTNGHSRSSTSTRSGPDGAPGGPCPLCGGRAAGSSIASGMTFIVLPFAVAYATSKHGVPAYSRPLRMKHGDAISVTTLYPGYIKTPIQNDARGILVETEPSLFTQPRP